MVVGGPHTPPFHFSCNGAEPFHESCSLIVLCMKYFYLEIVMRNSQLNYKRSRSVKTCKIYLSMCKGPQPYHVFELEDYISTF